MKIREWKSDKSLSSLYTLATIAFVGLYGIPVAIHLLATLSQ